MKTFNITINLGFDVEVYVEDEDGDVFERLSFTNLKMAVDSALGREDIYKIIIFKA